MYSLGIQHVVYKVISVQTLLIQDQHAKMENVKNHGPHFTKNPPEDYLKFISSRYKNMPVNISKATAHLNTTER